MRAMTPHHESCPSQNCKTVAKFRVRSPIQVDLPTMAGQPYLSRCFPLRLRFPFPKSNPLDVYPYALREEKRERRGTWLLRRCDCGPLAAAAAAGVVGIRRGRPLPLPARRVHDAAASSGGLEAGGYPPRSEVAAKLDKLLEELKATKLDSISWKMANDTLASFLLVRKEMFFRDIGQSWTFTAFVIAGYYAGYAMEQEKNRKRREGIVS